MRREEQLLKDFYYWEIRYRGWGLFDYPVDLEVPFVPFPERHDGYPKGYDDGKALSLLGHMRALVNKKEHDVEDQGIIYQYPKEHVPKRNLFVLVLSFPLDFESSVVLFRELITTLSFTRDPVSFEIIATSEDISIQLVCSKYDLNRVRSHLRAYFPSCRIHEGEQWDVPFEQALGDIAVIDFGLEYETMLPLRIVDRFDLDPLTSLFALFESLKHDESAMLQIMIQGIDSPLSSHFRYAVSDGMGGSFLADVPELVSGCDRKTESPLLSAAIRLAVQGRSHEHTAYLGREAITSITSVTTSEYNNLIPLSNKGYDYNQHMMNLLYRSSNRHGMILSVNEVATLFHYPNKSIVSQKLRGDTSKTKAVPPLFTKQKYILGVNTHEGVETYVSLSDEMRLKHTHVLGATGTGKSTYLAHSLLHDIEAGNGCALFDPHGDIVEDVLLRIPEKRKHDVIVIDPSDTTHAIGFNLLYAETETEKLVLSSDLIAAFRDNATSWGDTMTSVLSNAVDTFLDSTKVGTLIDLKRFLIEDGFRKKFLAHVSDPQLLYYWQHEYGMVRKRISPLITRLDTFLRPKVIRSMLVQTGGLNLGHAVASKKIILFKLSVGLVGEQNAYLLGSLFLSKLNQVALGRQSISVDRRHPFYVYLDECQHFMTPSIRAMLSGVRKYGFGLTLAHQYLGQLTNPASLESILSNPYTRLCFRLSHTDAKKLEYDFSGFEAQDMLSLVRGQSVVRFGSNMNDCTMSTFPLSGDMNKEQRQEIITHSQTQYGTPKERIDALLAKLYEREQSEVLRTPQTNDPIPQEKEEESELVSEKVSVNRVQEHTKEDILKRAKRTETLREHRKVQARVKKLGQDHGFVSVIEHEIQDSKRIDVSLERNDLRIACEISVTNSTAYEMGNIEKCFEAGYDMILVISDNESHLQSIKQKAKKELPAPLRKNIFFLQSSQVEAFLLSTKPKEKPQTEIIKGYRVKTEFVDPSQNEADQFRKDIERILRKKRK